MSIRNLWEVTLDVSVLIVFLAVIRKIFKKKLNPNVVYFLWIFVLICILIPIRIEINLESPFKAPYQEHGTIYNVPLLETVKLPEGMLPFIDGMGTAGIKSDGMEADGMGLNNMNLNNMSPDNMGSDLSVSKPQRKVSLNGILYTVWGTVAAAFLFYIVLVNIRLYLYVKHNRKPAGRWKGLKVYSLSGYNCLMGILHPAIYVDMERLESRELADNVMRHEYRHFQAKDNIWQLLRTTCLILQWHNPFVWWAYYASKQDCELACDAGVVGKLSEEARYQYCRCLLTISEHKSRAAENMLLATSMGESAERLKERIELIMKYQQKKTTVLAILLFCTIGFISVAAVKVVKADNEFFMKESDENTMEQTALAESDIIENNTTQVIPLAVSIEDYYSTNLGNPGNLYHIDENHVLWGCGKNDYGQLGLGTKDDNFYEEFVQIAENVKHVDYSQNGFTIYLTEDEKLYGIGNARTGALQSYKNISGKLVLNEEDYVAASPKLLMEKVVYASCGQGDIVCLLEDGSVWTWGTVWRQGNGLEFIEKPKKILENALIVTGGWFNHAALLEDGSVWTWGYNYAGNCGVKGKIVVSEPVKVAEDAVMVWTGRTENNVDCTDISEFDGWNKEGLENTIILKADGTYWACGAGIGEEEKILSPYWEMFEASVICSDEFMQISSEKELHR